MLITDNINNFKLICPIIFVNLINFYSQFFGIEKFFLFHKIKYKRVENVIAECYVEKSIFRKQHLGARTVTFALFSMLAIAVRKRKTVKTK
jgi:hypothetical protein